MSTTEQKQAKYIYVSPLNAIFKIANELRDEQGVYFETNHGNFDICDCLLLHSLTDVKRCKKQLNADIKF